MPRVTRGDLGKAFSQEAVWTAAGSCAESIIFQTLLVMAAPRSDTGDPKLPDAPKNLRAMRLKTAEYCQFTLLSSRQNANYAFDKSVARKTHHEPNSFCKSAR
ncbi:hypothetical protein RRG08_023739 [Elysia crispata]|uniref:Uncharacterized protein n=1 Tax=Elysia crispata TaxID=231223 RepID=A0AAE1DMN8_9GAST|nr:hypothetical protein RRG08_023739 [Elysia crispata]